MPPGIGYGKRAMKIRKPPVDTDNDGGPAGPPKEMKPPKMKKPAKRLGGRRPA